MNEEQNKVRVLELDAFRGFAALFVVFYHLTLATSIHQMMRFGSTGVELFFLISGFVIFLTVLRINRPADFIVSRFARLYPSYWTCLLFTSLLYLLVYPALITPAIFTVNLTMLQRFINVIDIDPSYWTLAVELMFYALIFLLVITKRLKSIEVFGSALMVALLLFHFVLPLYAPQSHEKIGRHFEFLRYSPFFFAGVIFYNLKTLGNAVHRHLLIIGCLVFCIFLHEQSHTRSSISFGEHATITTVYYGIFYLFVYGKMKWAVNPVTLFFGKISYPLYLIHQFFSNKLVIPYLTSSVHLPQTVAIIIAIIFSILIATAVSYLVETPMNGYIRNLYKQRMAKNVPVRKRPAFSLEADRGM